MASKGLRAGLLATAGFGGALLLPPTAHAQTVVEYGPISTALVQAVGRLVSSVRLALVNTGKQVADASNTTNADFGMSLEEMRITRDHTESPATCAAVDAGQAINVSSRQTHVVAAAVQDFLDRRSEGQPNNSSHEGAGQSSKSALNDHLSFYCSDLDAENALCGAQSPRWQSADRRAGNLFGNGITFTDDDAAAAEAYVVNLTQPLVPVPLRGSQAKALDAGFMAARNKYDASESLAHLVLTDILASQTPTISNLGQDLQNQQVAEGRPATAKASWYEVMDLTIRYRQHLPYNTALAKMPGSPVSREIARQNNVTNELLWAMYRRNDQIAALLAADLSYRAEDRYMRAQQQAASPPSPQTAGN